MSVVPSHPDLFLRRAVAEDVDQIDALHGHPRWLRPAFADPGIGPGQFTVVAHGDQVVSTLCLLSLRLRVGVVEIAAGQPEWVHTHKDFRNRGLVRAQMAEVHRWSDERGDLLQIIEGIPYFYRQFGYEYGLEEGQPRLLKRPHLPVPKGTWTLRQPRLDDLPSVLGIRTDASLAADIATVPTEQRWRHRLAEWGLLMVAERDGEIHAIAGVENDEGETPLVRSAVARSPDALWALLENAFGHSDVLEVETKPSVARLIDPITTPLPPWTGQYVRVADPVALLERLRPELERRLQDSPIAAARGTLLISTYRMTIVIEYDYGTIAPIRTTAGIQNPTHEGAAGVAPDHLAELILGRWGATAMAERYDDVRLGNTATIMEALFPRLTVDLNG